MFLEVPGVNPHNKVIVNMGRVACIIEVDVDKCLVHNAVGEPCVVGVPAGHLLPALGETLTGTMETGFHKGNTVHVHVPHIQQVQQHGHMTVVHLQHLTFTLNDLQSVAVDLVGIL